MKVYKEAYISTQGYFTPSATVPMSYFTFAMATGGVILLLIGIFVAVYATSFFPTICTCVYAIFLFF
jgi:hypothetical protein